VHAHDHRSAVRGPFTRWPRAADAVLALTLLLLSVMVVDGPGDSLHLRAPGEVPLPALTVFAVAAGALWWRRRAPVRALVVVLLCWTVLLGSGVADIGGMAIAAVYSVGRWADDDRWSQIGAAAGVLVLCADGLVEGVPWGETAFGGVVVFVAWYIGRRLRLRRQRAAELVREQAAQARRIVVEERTRIARELHDVVAHRVSSMTVQAGAAKAVAATDPDAALRAMTAVEEAGRQALDELRHLLGVMRPDAEADGTDPQPGLPDLSALVDRTRAAGLSVTISAVDLPPHLPAAVELSAYRIVQESLTNVLRHAGPGSRVDVRLSMEGQALRIDVVDDGPAEPPTSARTGMASGGHGIIGMRERTLLLGGTLQAGPRPGSGFAVVAHLPLSGSAA
jgi:signal transduction histidine kinase